MPGGEAPAPTVLVAWTETLLRSLADRGLDGAALAAGVGVTPEMLAEPDRRISMEVSTRLWAAAVDRTADDALGIDVSRHIRPGTFHVMSHAFLSSPTVGAALERAARYTRVTADIAEGRLVAGADGAAFELRWRHVEDRPAWEAVDAALASLVRTLRFLLGGDLSPRSVELERPTPRHAEAFRSFFRCPVRYEADRTAVVFDRTLLDRTIPGGNETLAAASDHAVAAYLASLGGDSVIDRLRLVLVDLVAHDPDITTAAAEMALSPRSLQRRLAEEHTSYRDVLARVRCELAGELLRSGVSVTETGLRLGFSETAAFSRAYRRWTGVSPSRSALGRANR